MNGGTHGLVVARGPGDRRGRAAGGHGAGVGQAVMKVLAIGFPRGVPVPTNVLACSDGIHTAAMRWGERKDCECGRLTIGPPLGRPAFWAGVARVILLDASMDGTEVGDSRRVRGRMVSP